METEIGRKDDILEIGMSSHKAGEKHHFRRAVVNKVRSMDLHGCLKKK